MPNSIKMLKHVYCIACTDTESQSISAVAPCANYRNAIEEMQKVYKGLKESLLASGEIISRSHMKYGTYIIKTKSHKEFFGNIVRLELADTKL